MAGRHCARTRLYRHADTSQRVICLLIINVSHRSTAPWQSAEINCHALRLYFRFIFKTTTPGKARAVLPPPDKLPICIMPLFINDRDTGTSDATQIPTCGVGQSTQPSNSVPQIYITDSFLLLFPSTPLFSTLPRSTLSRFRSLSWYLTHNDKMFRNVWKKREETRRKFRVIVSKGYTLYRKHACINNTRN